MLGYPYAGGGEIPYGCDAGGDELVGGSLRCLDGHGQDAHRDAHACDQPGHARRAVDGYAADVAAVEAGVGVDAGHYLEPVALQARVAHEGGAKRAGADDEGGMGAAEAEEVAQGCLERGHFIADAGLALDVDIRQVFGYAG